MFQVSIDLNMHPADLSPPLLKSIPSPSPPWPSPKTPPSPTLRAAPSAEEIWNIAQASARVSKSELSAGAGLETRLKDSADSAKSFLGKL